MRIKDVLNNAAGAKEPKPRRISQALKAYLDKDVTTSSTPKVTEITIGETKITESTLKTPTVTSITIGQTVIDEEKAKKIGAEPAAEEAPAEEPAAEEPAAEEASVG